MTEMAQSSTESIAYTLPLERFQLEAHAMLQAGHDILVTAPTGAGKTMCILPCLEKAWKSENHSNRKQAKTNKLIYTAPLKTLCNMKYHELGELADAFMHKKNTHKDQFKQPMVGLITGEVSLNEDAPVIVMTTEILRYHVLPKSTAINEIGTVVFDEAHYLYLDSTRGTVYEQLMILLPSQITLILLSATLGEPETIAAWLTAVRGGRHCKHIACTKRPVPLNHFVFQEPDILVAVDSEHISGRQQKMIPSISTSVHPTTRTLHAALHVLQRRQMLPCIVFVFNRRECESKMLSCSDFDLTTDDEKRAIDTIWNNAMNSLLVEEREILQIQALYPFLSRGVCCHHSGLLPVLKETIELIYIEGLLKILFATETFAMGINMPARSVLFATTQKFDGSTMRRLRPHEYSQMAGRAGRRGLDTVGFSVVIMEPGFDYNDMFLSNNVPLSSQLCITPHLLLSIDRTEHDLQRFLDRSLRHYLSMRHLPNLRLQLKQHEMNAFYVEESSISELEDALRYKQALEQLMLMEKQLLLRLPMIVRLQWLETGRIVVLQDELYDDNDRNRNATILAGDDHAVYDELAALQRSLPTIGIVLGILEKWAKQWTMTVLLRDDNNQPQIALVSVNLARRILSARINVACLNLYDPVIQEQLLVQANRAAASAESFSLFANVNMDFTNSDYNNDDQMSNYAEWSRRALDISSIIKQTHVFRRSYQDKQRIFALLEWRLELERRIHVCRRQIMHAEKNTAFELCLHHQKLLRSLKLINIEGMLTAKGRFALEILTANALLTTEIVFTGVLSGLPADEFAAICSCLLDTERHSADNKPIPVDLESKYYAVQEVAMQLESNILNHNRSAPAIFEDSSGNLDSNYSIGKVHTMRSGLMLLVLKWCRGASFVELCALTDMFEGSIVRHIRRLAELLRQMQIAASAIEAAPLEAQLRAAQSILKRGLIFSASLYI